MPRGKADISNCAIRVFLQEIGEEYDRARGFEVFNARKHFGDVRSFFNNSCCYCGASFEDRRAVQDHLIPLNKDAAGLHAWGNVVPACSECNAKKQGRDWQDFLIERGDTAEDMRTRRATLEAFRKKYRYAPEMRLSQTANELYADVGSVTIALIEMRVARAKSAFTDGR